MPAWAEGSTTPSGPATGQEDASPENPADAPREAAESRSESTNSEAPQLRETVVVRSRIDDLTGIARSAAEGATGAEELEARPLLRAGELVETVPGLIATQHSGGGKANQYFLRGFNLDHGTDFRIAVDGMPVNLPSHGHGQGYADLNFIIPELVDTVRFRKGAYDASVGDFAAAGSAELEYRSELEQGLLRLEGGELGHRRLLFAESLELAGGTLLAGMETARYDGPWTRPEDNRRRNGVLRFQRGDRLRGLTLTAMGYDGSWNSTDQVPLRALESGSLGRFDAVDPDLGGESDRYSLSAQVRFGDDRRMRRVEAFAVSYSLDLTSNFTYNLDDPSDDLRVDGDQFVQLDRRTILGVRYREQQSLGRIRLRYGAEATNHRIRNGLFDARGGVAGDAVRRDRIRQSMLGAHVEAEFQAAPKLRLTGGLRGDLYLFDVDDLLGGNATGTGTPGLAGNSGRTDDGVLSPQFSLAAGPWKRTELYVNAGLGFHSNDARGTVIRLDPAGEAAERAEPLVQARTVDVGVRTTVIPGLQSTFSWFGIELDSELVFVGDGGGTEAGPASRRSGVEWANVYRPLPWLTFDLDMTYSRARFRGVDPAEDRIPGAVETTVAAGVAVERGAWAGALRWRYLGSYALVEDDSLRADPVSLVNGRVAYRFENGVALTLEGFNLLDADDYDIQYAFASRLPGEPVGGIEDRHVHAVEPRSVRFSVGWNF